MAEPSFQGKCTECDGWHRPTLRFGGVVACDSPSGLAQSMTMWFWCPAKLAKFRPSAIRKGRVHA